MRPINATLSFIDMSTLVSETGLDQAHIERVLMRKTISFKDERRYMHLIDSLTKIDEVRIIALNPESPRLQLLAFDRWLLLASSPYELKELWEETPVAGFDSFRIQVREKWEAACITFTDNKPNLESLVLLYNNGIPSCSSVQTYVLTEIASLFFKQIS